MNERSPAATASSAGSVKSVRRSGKRARITARLSDVVDGFRLWSERYDREIEDVFAAQDEIATARRLSGKMNCSTLTPPSLPFNGL